MSRKGVDAARLRAQLLMLREYVRRTESEPELPAAVRAMLKDFFLQFARKEIRRLEAALAR